MRVPRACAVLRLALVAATAAAARPAASAASAAYRYWSGCEAPAYCQPATGPGLVPAEPRGPRSASVSARNGTVTPRAAAAKTSPLWGVAGEAFKPSGRLMDWSYAGYKQGREAIPTPPVTKTYTEFRKPGMSDGAALEAALGWAHAQPRDQWVVIRVPAGTHVLDRQLWIQRPRLVLRGDGSDKTFFKVDKPLKDTPGVKKPGGGYGFYNQQAFVEVSGRMLRDPALTVLTGAAERGDTWVTVRDASGLRAGEAYALILSDTKAGPLTKHLLNDRVPPLPLGRVGPGRTMLVRFVARVLQVQGKRVQLERALPFRVRPDYSPQLLPLTGTVYESGVEGLTFNFKHAMYAGHHYEHGYNAIEFKEAFYSWARDIAVVNCDSGIFIDKCVGIEVRGFRASQTKPRDPKKPKSLGDAHWGIHSGSSADILVDGFDVGNVNFLHSVGADAMAMFGVFTRGKGQNVNLELHRGLAGKTLFTDIDVGLGDHAFQSGGPEASGSNTQAFTTFWNIRAAGGAAVPPPGSNTAKQGDCSFGPDLTFVGVRMSGKICASWYSEGAAPVEPANLFDAQRARRASLPAPALVRRQSAAPA